MVSFSCHNSFSRYGLTIKTVSGIYRVAPGALPAPVGEILTDSVKPTLQLERDYL
jgi:hypothetical protein